MRVPGIDDATAIGADGASTCVRRKDGSVACWGQLAPTVEVATPSAIEMTDTVQLAGRCARSATQVECLSNRSQVIAITGADDAIDVAAFANDGCVVHKGGTLAGATAIAGARARWPREVLGSRDVGPGRQLHDARCPAADRGRLVAT